MWYKVEATTKIIVHGIKMSMGTKWRACVVKKWFKLETTDLDLIKQHWQKFNLNLQSWETWSQITNSKL